ncbi:hypothetical protein ACFX16_036394 [Malus domestica]
MGKASYKKLTGSQNLRQRLVLAALASTPVLIEDIRAEETWPGLRPHEVSSACSRRSPMTASSKSTRLVQN